MTQPDLAEASGVSLKTIVNVEGEHSVRPTTARKLADALDVSVTVLAGVEPFPARQLPVLTLAEMYEAEPDIRRRALEAAAADEVARYVAEIDSAVRNAERALQEELTATLPDPPPQPPPHVLLSRYVHRLVFLKAEAQFYTAHAGVAEEEYPEREALRGLIPA